MLGHDEGPDASGRHPLGPSCDVGSSPTREDSQRPVLPDLRRRRTASDSTASGIRSHRPSVDRSSVTPPAGTVAVWPIRSDGSKVDWRIAPERLRELLDGRATSVSAAATRRRATPIYYLERGEIAEDGSRRCSRSSGEAEDGSVIRRDSGMTSRVRPEHAMEHGLARRRRSTERSLLSALLPGRTFPVPEVALRGRGRAPLLRRRQARRRGSRLLRRVGDDRPRRDASEPAGRRPAAVASR